MLKVAHSNHLDDILQDITARDAAFAPVAKLVHEIAGAAIEMADVIALGLLYGDGAAAAGDINGSGDVQKKLDVFGHDLFVNALRRAPVAVLLSEELDEPLVLDSQAPLAVAMDPVDGSSNINANVSIGTIFSVLPRLAGADDPKAHFLQPGRNQVAAGFVIYGPQTAIVLAADGATVSIDTMNASTARAAVDLGARIVNDVSGGLADPDMLAVVAASGADVVLQHWRGPSAHMYAHAAYDDLARDLVHELEARLRAAADAGISPDRVILDPGIGFGKHGAQNWEALRALDRIVAIGPRVLVGTSRKRFLAEALAAASPDRDPDVPTPRRDLATAVTSVLAAQAGAWAVRVHDVAATRDALTVRTRWSGDQDSDDGGKA